MNRVIKNYNKPYKMENKKNYGMSGCITKRLKEGKAIREAMIH